MQTITWPLPQAIKTRSDRFFVASGEVSQLTNERLIVLHRCLI